jgi:hypothetical protein
MMGLRHVLLGLAALSTLGTPASCAPSPPSTALIVSRQALVLELLLDGNARDTSGSDSDGVVEGATLVDDRFGRPGRAYHFDGDDFIMVSPPPSLSREALTVSVWARYDSSEFDWWNNAILCQDSGDEDGRRIIQLSTEDRSITWHRMDFGRDAHSLVPLEIGRWYHVVVTFDGAFHHLYIDGLLHDSRRGRLISHPDEPLYLGRKGSDEPEFNFRGGLDDLRIYNRALTGEEILQFYGEG